MLGQYHYNTYYIYDYSASHATTGSGYPSWNRIAQPTD